MTTEYLRRNQEVCKAIGAHANSKSAIARLQAVKRAPRWIVQAFEGIRDRTAALPAELASWRDSAEDRPNYVTPHGAEPK